MVEVKVFATFRFDDPDPEDEQLLSREDYVRGGLVELAMELGGSVTDVEVK